MTMLLNQKRKINLRMRMAKRQVPEPPKKRPRRAASSSAETTEHSKHSSKEDRKYEFKYLEAWRILRDSLKWAVVITPEKGKKDGQQNCLNPASPDEVRPQGQKSAKDNAKSGNLNALADAHLKIAQRIQERNDLTQLAADILLFSGAAADDEDAEVNQQAMKLLKKRRLEALLSPR